MNNPFRKRLATLATLAAMTLAANPPGASAEAPDVDYRAEIIAGTGCGNFAPTLIANNRGGILANKNNALLHLGFDKATDLSRRFSYGFGFDAYGGASSAVTYRRYDADSKTWNPNRERQQQIWLQQLYAEAKYRGVYLCGGLRERHGIIGNYALSAGDVIRSNNARPLPQVSAGFVDFQKIPFTKGFLYISGDVTYGWYTQNHWLKDHFNYWSGSFNVNTLYHYKNAYFRTNPQLPFSVTAGAQHAVLFGGTTYRYSRGKLTATEINRSNQKGYWAAFIPQNNGREGYIEGGHLGTWDFKFRYRIRSGHEFALYLQNLWEDGSGMAKFNGWDGLWGFEYRAPRKQWISAATFEILSFTNQGGPCHWDPSDNPGTSLNDCQATGGDSYYNNFFYNAFANYGQAMGCPFFKAPIYNLNGSLEFLNTRTRGFHAGLEGDPTDRIHWRVLGAWRKSWGTYARPLNSPTESLSAMAEATYAFPQVKGLQAGIEIGADKGHLFGNNAGVLFTLKYSGTLKLSRR